MGCVVGSFLGWINAAVVGLAAAPGGCGGAGCAGVGCDGWPAVGGLTGAAGVAGLATTGADFPVAGMGGLAGVTGGGGAGGTYFTPRYSYNNSTPSSVVAMKIWYWPCRSHAIFAIPSGSRPRDEVNFDHPLIFLAIT